jgi:hypothetical protein
MFNVKNLAYIQLNFEKYKLKYKYWNQGVILKHKNFKKYLKRRVERTFSKHVYYDKTGARYMARVRSMTSPIHIFGLVHAM